MNPMRRLALAAAVTAVSAPAFAAPFTAIRIGDVDGFGFVTDVGSLTNVASDAPGDRADVNGNGRLEQTEFLPSLGGSSGVVVNSDDEFDNRTIAEQGGTYVTGSGFSNSAGTTGSDFTDISLTQSYDTRAAAGAVYRDPSLAGGVGAFPAPPSATLTNQPGFEFRFEVAKGDINPVQDIFFNVLFGDYDVAPANITITLNDGTGAAGGTRTLPLTVQPNNKDGLIQASFATLAFSDVFSDSGTVWTGFLDVDFAADAEPYTAFDFVELSTKPIPFEPDPVPEPATLGLLGLLLGGTALRRARRRA